MNRYEQRWAKRLHDPAIAAGYQEMEQQMEEKNSSLTFRFTPDSYRSLVRLGVLRGDKDNGKTISDALALLELVETKRLQGVKILFEYPDGTFAQLIPNE